MFNWITTPASFFRSIISRAPMSPWFDNFSRLFLRTTACCSGLCWNLDTICVRHALQASHTGCRGRFSQYHEVSWRRPLFCPSQQSRTKVPLALQFLSSRNLPALATWSVPYSFTWRSSHNWSALCGSSCLWPSTLDAHFASLFQRQFY